MMIVTLKTLHHRNLVSPRLRRAVVARRNPRAKPRSVGMSEAKQDAPAVGAGLAVAIATPPPQ